MIMPSSEALPPPHPHLDPSWLYCHEQDMHRVVLQLYKISVQAL